MQEMNIGASKILWFCFTMLSPHVHSHNKPLHHCNHCNHCHHSNRCLHSRHCHHCYHCSWSCGCIKSILAWIPRSSKIVDFMCWWRSPLQIVSSTIRLIVHVIDHRILTWTPMTPFMWLQMQQPHASSWLRGNCALNFRKGAFGIHVVKKSTVGVKGAFRPKPFLCGAILHDDLPGGDLESM